MHPFLLSVNRFSLHCETFAKVDFFDHFVADDFVTCSMFKDFAVVQNITAVRNTQCFADVVVGDNHAQAAVL